MIDWFAHELVPYTGLKLCMVVKISDYDFSDFVTPLMISVHHGFLLDLVVTFSWVLEKAILLK